jgi:hypothetical protein
MTAISKSFSITPSLLGDPPRNTNASKYSSPSALLSVVASRPFKWVKTEMRVEKSIFVAPFASR